jgi:hypothetical protein
MKKSTLGGLFAIFIIIFSVWLLIEDFKSGHLIRQEIVYIEIPVTTTPIPVEHLENDEVYSPPTKIIDENYIHSGEWSDIPFDQNQDGEITCEDFIGENPGLDNLLDLAYNRYNLSYLDSNGDGVPCNE